MTQTNNRVRCAIYTRKSTEEGLEQEYNTLDAQRDAGEAYILSQKAEGWLCLPDRYDDGGYTGGNMERPALKRLMADIEAGKVDCIVVYKVDRLSRSLLDFARIMETLEKREVSFVSVTQQFNTTNSMGRLMLNVLLSFAQFEREIIAERTRDKIHAARRKGKWTGGHPLLGYDVAPDGGRLLVNEEEAKRVTGIFELYLENQSLIGTIKELDRRGWTTKQFTTRKGHERGGAPFTKHTLFRLLTNLLYQGKITCGKQVYDAEHPAIVDAEIFERVGRCLRRNGRTGGRDVRTSFNAILKGLVHCTPCNSGMVHTHSTKGNKRYRYYACLNAQKRGWHVCPSKSIPAPEIERYVVEQIRSIGRDHALVAETIRQTGEEARNRIVELEQEQAALERQLARENARLRALVPKGEVAVDGMADLQDRVRAAEQRATEVREELIALRRELLDERELASALTAFDPVWDSMAPKEQWRVMRLLVQRVDYDGAKGTVSVTFHPSGIKTLAQKLEETR